MQASRSAHCPKPKEVHAVENKPFGTVAARAIRMTRLLTREQHSGVHLECLELLSWICKRPRELTFPRKSVIKYLLCIEVTSSEIITRRPRRHIEDTNELGYLGLVILGGFLRCSYDPELLEVVENYMVLKGKAVTQGGR